MAISNTDAFRIYTAAKADLGQLTFDQTVDLIADNFPDESLDDCRILATIVRMAERGEVEIISYDQIRITRAGLAISKGLN